MSQGLGLSSQQQLQRGSLNVHETEGNSLVEALLLEERGKERKGIK